MTTRRYRIWLPILLALLTLTCETITAPTQGTAPDTGQGDENNSGDQSSRVPTPTLAQTDEQSSPTPTATLASGQGYTIPTPPKPAEPGTGGGGQQPIGTAVATQNTQFPTPPPTARIAFYATGFTMAGGGLEIFVMNPDGSGLTPISNSAGDDIDPAWSPDGRRIAFASDRDGEYEIYIMNADGSNPIRLTNSPERDLDPTWSPDGKKIAFSTIFEGASDLQVVNVNGSGLTRLTNTAMIIESYPDWSPDGQLILFSKYGQGFAGIYAMNTDGSNIRLILAGGVHNDAKWSPDGKYIAYWGQATPCTTEVFIMRADGSDSRQVTTHPGCGDNQHPSWSPDGKQIVYMSSDRELDPEPNQHEENIYVINMDGSGETPLTHGVTKMNYGGLYPDWSPVP